MAALTLLSAAALSLIFETARAAHADSMRQLPIAELRVDSERQARVFCNGIQVMVNLCDLFEFYERSLTGERKRILLVNPWESSIKENYPGSYSLNGNDPASGAEYAIVFQQADSRTIKLFITFRTPSRASNLEFGIAKLSGDLFKGGTLVARPATILDARNIPVEPRSAAARMLLTGKKRILVRGVVCDIEIEELTDTKSMYAADGRNVPWDKFKSIIFGAGAANLDPGSRYSFQYALRCLPPSLPETVQRAKVFSHQVGEFNAWSFFNIPPKEETKKEGYYQLRAGDHIYGSPSGTEEAVLKREIAKLTSIDLDIQSAAIALSGRGIVIERLSRDARPDIPQEGYEIVVTPDKAFVRAIDERGCLYGVYALIGRLAAKSGVWGIECEAIKDWPDQPVRGVCLALLQPAIRDVAVMKRYMDAFSRARSNVVIFLHDPPQMRSWIRNADDGGWTKDQMAEIARYARRLHMDVWGGMGSAFSPADFRELDIRNGTNFYNPFSDKNYKYLFSLYEEILKVYAPSTLLISHDEIQGLSVYAAESGRSTAEILASDVGRIHDWLKQHNVWTAMWGDMMLDHDRWEAEVGDANSQNPFFRSGATHLALQKIPRDVFILDWHYNEKKSYGSIDYFRRNGFKVAGAPWHDPKAAHKFAESIKRFSGQGIIATDWGIWRTMSPAATTLYAPLCGWSAQCRNDEGDSDVEALAETMRNPIYAGRSLKQTPVSLDEASNKATMALSDGNNNALFGFGRSLDLSAFQPGKQVLGGITFDMKSADGGRRNNCVVVSGSDRRLSGDPRTIALFKGNATALQIAFLQTCFVEEPTMNVRKLGWYLVEYDDGSSEKIDLLENWNITDIRSSEGLRQNAWSFLRSPDILIGAKPVWRGNSASGIPLNLQLFIWNNPRPGKRIRSIRLVANDEPKGTKLALLGLTLLSGASPK